MEAGVPRTWCGPWLASGSKEGTVRLWNLKTRATITLPYPEPNSTRSLAFSPDGRLLAVAKEDGSISIWQAGGAGPTQSVLLNSKRPVSSVAFSRDGRSLAAGSVYDSDSTPEGPHWRIKLWDLGSDPPTAQVLD